MAPIFFFLETVVFEFIEKLILINLHVLLYQLIIAFGQFQKNHNYHLGKRHETIATLSFWYFEGSWEFVCIALFSLIVNSLDWVYCMCHMALRTSCSVIFLDRSTVNWNPWYVLDNLQFMSFLKFVQYLSSGTLCNLQHSSVFPP